MKEMPFRQSRRRVLRAVPVGVGSTIAGCLSSLTSEDPEKPERSENAPPLKWISNIKRYPWHTPAIANQTVVAGNSYHVTALDATDGAERWSYEIDTPNDYNCYSGKLDVADGTVYTQGCDEVYALKAGEVQWAVGHGRKHLEPATVPAIAESALFIGGYNLVRRDRATGTQQWKTEISGKSQARPALGEEYVFVGSYDGHLEAFDRTSGVHRFALDTETDHASAPVVADGMVFVGTAVFEDEGEGTGYLYAADIDEERWLWHVETGHILNDLPPAVNNGTVFVASDAGIVYAISMTDESVQWTFETRAEHPSVPRVGGDLVFVASGDTVHAIDIDTGEQRWYVTWTDRTVNGRDSPPLVTADSLYVGVFDRLYSFDFSK